MSNLSSSFLRDAKIDLTCPECKRSFKVTLDDVRHERTVRCPTGHQINLKNADTGLQGVERSLDNLEQSIKDLNGRLRF